MNGQVTMAQWLIDNKNGKAWSKYGKERVYINIYAGGVQVANYFYDVITDKFFGCNSQTEKEIRKEFEKATTTEEEKLQKELEIRESMLRTQLQSRYASQEVIEENKKRIAELKKAIEATTEEATTEEATTEETATEETATEETATEETATEETATEETKKISTVDLQNFLSSKVSFEINAKVELKKIIKIIANKTQQTLQKEEIKEIATNKKIGLVFQEQILLLVFSRLEKTHKIHNLEDWTSYLLYSQDFDDMIKNIKDFIKEEKKGGD